ncbi:TIGR03016 family PEP-CTERM system-associated outer membrane protein [Halorhodospira sp. M38]|uniref:TIGR03016 family PEP-CTERM system-associated outer membrane protein n=2 Tax=unclassified Halorhodospira TaxID=2626748 RepID=UPI001EE84CC3|nr:TIGR03016 family PEP-CTERM system-associated outer membrane protein [Halorhodospira sp. M39old]MCG5545117.1 TIGR03016 family PEP-CTERM system-associated outer membrane protein [Halorhodospira sp. M38]
MGVNYRIPGGPLGCVLVMSLLLSSAGAAAEGVWSFTPRVTIGAEITDNARFAPRGEERGDGIGVLEPGLSLSGEGARTSLDLDYAWDNRYRIRDTERDRSVHSLRGRGRYEVLADAVFIEGAIFRDIQADSLLEPISSENLEERTRYRLSPFWRARYGSLAEQELRYIYEELRYHQSDREGTQAHRGRYRLSSGSAFNRPDWSLMLSYDENRYDRSASVERYDAAFSGGYRLGRAVRLGGTVAQGRINSADQEFDVDSWRAEFGWRPTRATGIGASYGETRFGDADAREVRGLSVTHRTRRATLLLSYDEGVTDFGQTLDDDLLALLERRGQWTDAERRELDRLLEIIDPNLARILREIDELIVPEVAFTETWRARWLYDTGRSTFALGLRQREIDDRFIFDSRPDERLEQERSVDGSWVWSLGPRTDLTARLGVARTEVARAQQPDTRLDEWRAGVGLNRELGSRATGRVEYQYRHNERSGAFDDERRENRLLTRLRMEF